MERSKLKGGLLSRSAGHGHVWLTDALQVFERHASPNLQPILQEGLQVAEQHLTHAKSLLARIEQIQPKSTALRQNEHSNAR